MFFYIIQPINEISINFKLLGIIIYLKHLQNQ